MNNLLSIENTAFEVFGYPVSYLEFTGTLFNLVSVILIARRNIWTWPAGIIAVSLFFLLFYQARLYSDMFEQVYFFITCIWGWIVWSRAKPAEDTLVGVQFSSRTVLLTAVVVAAILSIVVGRFMKGIHELIPSFFPGPADLPYLDALTTMASFTATILMIQRRTECWIYWIGVDVIGIGLYAYKELYALSMLYAIFLVLASWGLYLWTRGGRSSEYPSITAAHS